MEAENINYNFKTFTSVLSKLISVMFFFFFFCVEFYSLFYSKENFSEFITYKKTTFSN